MSRPTYDASHFEALASVEQSHFWFGVRNRVIAEMFRSLPGPKRRFLEAGCGTGNVLREMTVEFPETNFAGFDLHQEGLRFASKRSNAMLAVADANHLPFTQSFDVAGLFDVIEHLDDDRQALRMTASVLRPNGWLLVTVPAAPELWSGFDEAACHRRRYTKESLRTAMTEAGLRPVFLSYFFPLNYPILRLYRNRASKVEDDLRLTPGLNGLMRIASCWEARWLASRKHIPFGSSLLGVAQTQK